MMKKHLVYVLPTPLLTKKQYSHDPATQYCRIDTKHSVLLPHAPSHRLFAENMSLTIALPVATLS